MSALRTILVATALGSGFLLADVSPIHAHPAIDVVASNWKFTPDSIEVHVGEATTVNLTSSAGVHGLESADVGFPKTMIVPGKTTAVVFTPKTAGTFALHCAIVCGAGHENMVLTVKVVP